MSQLLEAITVSRKVSKHSNTAPIGSSRKPILKSKENLFKPKCNKELKKKLKKYKLRRDGNEDPDVLNVSQILVNSLRIKSPNSENKLYNNSNIVDGDKLKFPNNYLFKMVRKKRVCTQIESLNDVNLKSSNIAKVSKDELLDEEAQNKNATNAFQLMMTLRNKSLGGNSPGKEKSNEDIDSQERIEQKEMKAKRLLSLQKMAQDKGAVKKKEMEEYRDRCIKKKMLLRAEKFKDMITKADLIIDEKVKNSSENKINNESDTCSTKEPDTTELNNLLPNTKVNTLKLCDLFSNENSVIESQTQTRVSNEDIEFLSKLSPSLKKKENMLSYFKKVSKKEVLTSDESEGNCMEETTAIIKVKFTAKKKNKKKFMLNQGNFSDVHEPSQMEENNERRKRKRMKPEKQHSNLKETNNLAECNNERPKRHVKKPTKYTENVHCLSSDEELHIFTPKKKKNQESTKCLESKKPVPDDITCKTMKIVKDNNKHSNNLKESVKNIKQSKIIKSLKNNKTSVREDEGKKAVKLAPIFVSKAQPPQEPIESKKKVLKNDINYTNKPKKNIVQQINEISSLENFTPVVHIQQCATNIKCYRGKDWFTISGSENEVMTDIDDSNFIIKQLLVPLKANSVDLPLLKQKTDIVLKSIKNVYPKFPVYRTYHSLKVKSKGEFKDINYPEFDNSVEILNESTDTSNEIPEQLNWCDKYKPTSSKQIIGNFESIKELKRWLESWTEKLKADKNNGSEFSDLSDFYCSDTDSRDGTRSTNNVLILTGQTGSGKTSSVYAVAAELSIKVIEVNASSKRNGKIMLQDLQEATRSHKVDRAKGSECLQKSQETETLDIKKVSRPRKSKENNKSGKAKKSVTPIAHLTPESLSQESVRTGMSLILIDDADIVFDQDDGFCSAISQLIQSSKRPVILVTSSLSCLHLQRFINIGKVIHMHPLLPRMLGTWLDIMCLADIGVCYTGLGEKLLDFNKGDIRKTINFLQFIMNSIKVNQEDFTLSQIKCNLEDESSSMSWVDSESMEGPINVIQSNMERNLQSIFLDSLDIFNVWWRLSGYFNHIDRNASLCCKSKENSKSIKKIANMLDTISLVDNFNHIKSNRELNITNDPWHVSENASLLEAENFESFNQLCCMNKEISSELISGTVSETEKLLIENDENVLSPGMSVQREKDKLVSRHNTLSSYLNPSSILDRRATALDYWPSCRTLCRLEKTKPDSNIKRNNRFCHYLKSVNILCKNNLFDSLADSLT